MKTTTSQTRLNGSAARLTPQGANQSSPPYARLELEINGTLHPESADFTEAEFAELKRAAEHCGLGIGAFITSAINEKMALNASREDRLKMLVGGCDESEDGLWATPEGQLYFWDGDLTAAARPATFSEVCQWWQKFHAKRPGVAEPYFDEKTDAAKFVSMVCEAINKAEAERVPDLETAIAQSITMAHIMEQHITENGPLPESRKFTFDLGLGALVRHANEQLHNAFYKENGGARVVAIQDRRAA